MGVPNRWIGLLGFKSSRGLCPGGVVDTCVAQCSYCLAEKGMSCVCCPMLCELLVHRYPDADRPTVDCATVGRNVGEHARKEIQRGLPPFGLDPRIREVWWPVARMAPALDRRVFSLLAIAVVPGFWVWPLRGHIKTVTVSAFALLRRDKRAGGLQGRGWKRRA